MAVVKVTEYCKGEGILSLFKQRQRKRGPQIEEVRELPVHFNRKRDKYC